MSVSEPALSLGNRGFLALLAAQFLGAANDNVLKQVLTFMVATGVWANQMGEGGQAYVALCLTLPFILLSGIAGQVADRHSKRTVMLAVKIAEIPIALIAFIGFLLPNLWVTLGAMLLLAVQSSFFGPAKYGVLPELVGDQELSRANGLLNMLTNLAIIVGSLLAGPVSDQYFPAATSVSETLAGQDSAEVAAALVSTQATRANWLPGAVLVGIAVLGLIAVLPVPRLRAQAPDLRYDFNPFGTYVLALREMSRGPLLMVAISWAFFYLVGMMALLILPDYQSILSISYGQTSLLLGWLGISIGIGSLAAGLISGHEIKPGLVPVGAIGMSVCFLLLGLVPPRFWNVALLLGATGVFAGFYIIPLQALLQHLSPDDERGRFLGTANAVSFLCSSIGAAIFWLAKNADLPSNRVFLVCATLSILGTSYAVIRMRRLVPSE